MSVLISGVLMNPAGVPVSGAEVTFSALTNGPSVLNGFSASVMTDQDGNYAIPLEICEYAISIQSDGYNSVYGSVSINEKSTPATINELLKLAAMEQAVTPAIIVYFREIQADVAVKLVTMQTLGTNAAEAVATAIAAKNEAAQYAQNLSAAVAQAQQASAAATASANAATTAKNAAETAAGNAQATLANAMLKGQFGWGGKAINIGSDVNLFVYFTRDTPAGLYWVNQTGINRPPGFADCVLLWNPIEHQDFYGCLLAIGFTTGGAKTASVNVANGVWENQWTVDWNTRNLNPVTANINQEIHSLKTFMANWASLVIKPEAVGQPSYLQGSDFDGSTRWTLGFQNINDDSLLLRNNKIGTTIALHQDGNVYVGGKDLILTDAKGFVRNARALEYAGGAEYGEFLKSQQSAGSAVVGGVWRAFLSVRHRGGNSNKEPGADSTQWGYALVDNNMTQGNFNEFVLEKTMNGTWLPAVHLKHSGNTVVGSGGALFTASPVIKIFSDGSFEANHDANGANVERLSEGVYKITGCQGMNSDPAWNGIDGGVKNPVCRNDKALLWNNYEVDEDGSVTVYTFHRVHRDAMSFAQNRLTLDKVPFDSEKGHTPEMEWPDQAPIDVPKGFFVQVRVNMPERIELKPKVMGSNVYCNSVSPA